MNNQIQQSIMDLLCKRGTPFSSLLLECWFPCENARRSVVRSRLILMQLFMCSCLCGRFGCTIYWHLGENFVNLPNVYINEYTKMHGQFLMLSPSLKPYGVDLMSSAFST